MTQIQKIMVFFCLSVLFVVPSLYAETVFQRWDGNNDGKVTHDERIVRLNSWFVHLDKNKDGKIHSEEMYLSEMMPDDKDQIITESEFIDFWVGPEQAEAYRKAEGMPHDVALLKLEIIDKNGDGTILIEDFIPYAKGRFQAMDKNGDKQIDAAEFNAFMNELHKAHDANANGHLTVQEFAK